MELLIPGIILVALMVYVSTRIKKSAASAFEPEVIEKEEFSIVKPEGFINPINENSGFLFEAYSKEFGKNDADESRQASANIISISNSNIENIIGNLKKSGENVLSKKFIDGEILEQKICLFKSEKTDAAIAETKFYKLVENKRQRKVYQLQISVLDAYREVYADRIEEMMESFVVT